MQIHGTIFCINLTVIYYSNQNERFIYIFACFLAAFLTMEERHQRTPADTSGHQQPPADTSSHQARRAAPRRRTRPPPGHISPPDGVPGGRVPRSEARGFHRESGKNPLFQFQIIRLLFSFEGNTKKGNRIPSDCLYILYVLSFLHTFPFSIFAKNKKSMKKRKLICTIVGIILGAPLGLVIGYILRKYILLLLQ